MKNMGFFYGGTITGRYPACPEAQELPRVRREPVANAMVTADFAEIERRILLSDVLDKIAADIIKKAFPTLLALIQERADDEGCGAVVAALWWPDSSRPPPFSD